MCIVGVVHVSACISAAIVLFVEKASLPYPHLRTYHGKDMLWTPSAVMAGVILYAFGSLLASGAERGTPKSRRSDVDVETGAATCLGCAASRGRLSQTRLWWAVLVGGGALVLWPWSLRDHSSVGNATSFGIAAILFVLALSSACELRVSRANALVRLTHGATTLVTAGFWMFALSHVVQPSAL
jgi:hypothetical protein